MKKGGQSIRGGATWLFVGNTGQQALAFLFGVVLARLLLPEDFGVLLSIQVFTGLAGFVAGGGMGQALVRSKTASEQDYAIVFTLQLMIGSVIYAMFFALAPWFAKWYQTPIYTDLLRVSALSFLLRPFVNMPSNMLHRAMRFKETAISGIASLVTGNGVSIVMAYLGYGVWSLIWGGLAGSVVGALVLTFAAKWRPRLSSQFRRGREIARYGFLVSLNDISYYIRSQVSIFILSRTLGPASVGLYNKGESLARMPHRFITGSVYPVLFRALAKEQEDLKESRRLYFLSIALVAVFATPLYVGLLWLAEPLMRSVYGLKWLDAAGPLSILAAAWPFWLVGNLSGNVLGARNWLTQELAVQLSTLIVTALAILAALPRGIDGVAWAIVGSTAFAATYQYWLITKCLQTRLSELARALVPAAVLNALLAATLCITDLALPPTVASHDVAYLFAMGLAGAAVYVPGFLFLPLRGLENEQNRWKDKLRLDMKPRR